MRTERRLHATIIRLSGEFDLSCDQPFREQVGQLLGVDNSKLIVDLCELTFIDSTGLWLLYELDRLGHERGYDFMIIRSDRQLNRFLKLTGLDEVLSLVDTHRSPTATSTRADHRQGSPRSPTWKA